jgi:hypothetical protein
MFFEISSVPLNGSGAEEIMVAGAGKIKKLANSSQ